MRRKLIVIGYSIGLVLALAGCNTNPSVGTGEDVQNDSVEEQLELEDGSAVKFDSNPSVGTGEDVQNDSVEEQLVLEDGSVVTFDSNIISQDTEMIYEIYTVKNFDENDISISDQYVYCNIPFAFTLDEEWCVTKFGNEVTEIIKNTERIGSRTVLCFKNGTEITKDEYDSFVNDYAAAME